MFGADDKPPAAAAPPGKWRPNLAVVAVELGFLAAGLGAIVLFWSFTTTNGLQRVVNRLVGDAPFSVTIGDVAIIPWSEPLHPGTWQLLVSDVQVTPKDPDGPNVHITRLVVGMPDLVHAWATRHLDWGRLILDGLDIHVKRQQKPKDWQPHHTGLALITSSAVEVWDADVVVDADPPLSGINVESITGVLRDVSYAPPTRELHGSGTLEARSFTDGAVELTWMRVGSIDATGTTLDFKDGYFRYAGGTSTFSGRVDQFQSTPDAVVTVSVNHIRIGDLVEAASGRPSPLSGLLDATFVAHAGGDTARGEAWMEGDAQLTDGSIQLPDGTKRIVVDLLKLAPYVSFDDATRTVGLGDMQGSLRFSRGDVEVKDLLYDAPRREIEVRGSLQEGAYALLVRMVPGDAARTGIGFVLTGVKKDVAVRLAREEELLGLVPLPLPSTVAPPADPPVDGTATVDPPGRAHPLIDRLKKRGKTEDTDR